jgi:hypothetical protein
MPLAIDMPPRFKGPREATRWIELWKPRLLYGVSLRVPAKLSQILSLPDSLQATTKRGALRYVFPLAAIGGLDGDDVHDIDVLFAHYGNAASESISETLANIRERDLAPLRSYLPKKWQARWSADPEPRAWLVNQPDCCGTTCAVIFRAADPDHPEAWSRLTDDVRRTAAVLPDPATWFANGIFGDPMAGTVTPEFVPIELARKPGDVIALDVTDAFTAGVERYGGWGLDTVTERRFDPPPEVEIMRKGGFTVVER